MKSWRLGIRTIAVLSALVLSSGCSNWLFDVVSSFGTPGGPKISTAAGNGKGGYAGNGVQATTAELYFPQGVAVDSAGNYYIADSTNCLIRKVDTSGVITTIAGSYSLGAGWSGDGGAATSAQLNNPGGVAVDPATGNIYIADTFNHVIREVVVSTGNISTVAGVHGTSGYNGDGLATSKLLSYPAGLAFDSSGNLYIADNSNSLVRELTGGNIVTIAGNHTLGPGYVGDGGQATNAELNFPYDVALDAAEANLYIADSYNNVIRKVVISTGIITTVAGNAIQGYSGDGGAATSAELNNPYGVAGDASGNIYLSDVNNSVVRKVVPSGTISTVAGNFHLGNGYAGDGNVATAAMLNAPWGIAVDSSGNLYIADNHNHRIRKVGLGR